MKVLIVIVLAWLLLNAFVQQDRHTIGWKNALYNSFLAPVVYLIIVPMYFLIKGYFWTKDWMVMYLHQRREHNG